jgi:hypothetical protein
MKRQLEEDEGDDEIDDDEIWASICKIAGEYADVSAERARTILEDAGQTADDPIGITEAIETVLWAVRRKWLPPER